MNGPQYLSILEERLKPMMRTRNCTMFMHDGPPCHMSRRTKSWLENKGIEVLGRDKISTSTRSKIFLAHSQNEGIHGEANDAGPTQIQISPSVCKALVHSMPKRIADVLKNKGQYTKY